MARKCRVLQTGLCEISWAYKKGTHNGIDLVGANYTLAWEVAHSDGKVVEVESNCNYNTYPNGKHIYGNYVKIKHDNGYYTLYAHMKYGSVKVKVGQRVKKGDILGYMGNTGYSNGGHLHFEVRNTNDSTIDPTSYLDADLPNDNSTINDKSIDELAREVIAGKYGNGEARKQVLGSRYKEVQDRVNEILLGKNTTKYLSNKNYKGYSIVDALKQIKVDSSFSYRSKLAQSNGITNYKGTADQNIKMLNMLKNGTLKSV